MAINGESTLNHTGDKTAAALLCGRQNFAACCTSRHTPIVCHSRCSASDSWWRTPAWIQRWFTQKNPAQEASGDAATPQVFLQALRKIGVLYIQLQSHSSKLNYVQSTFYSKTFSYSIFYILFWKWSSTWMKNCRNKGMNESYSVAKMIQALGSLCRLTFLLRIIPLFSR